ncbi:MAG: hypothetical protein Q4F05_04815 [bacterium]|nr:hypothetical protein [bacterium]
MGKRCCILWERLLIPLEDQEENEKAAKRREKQVEDFNEELMHTPLYTQPRKVQKMLEFIEQRNKVWNWISK